MVSKQLSRRDFLAMSGVAISGTALLAACGGTTNSPNETVTINFWNTGYATSDSNNKEKKPEDFFIYQSIKRFEEQNPGIKVKMQIVPDTMDMFTQYRVASIARNGPDVMTMWSGSYMLQFKQYLEPLNDYFSPEEKARIKGWDAVTEGYTGEGAIYGIPNSSAGITVILYNKDLMAKAKVDPETDWPKNFDEFLAMLEKIKVAGITPLSLHDYGYTFNSLDYWIAQVVGGESGIGDLVSGKRNFSDPELVEVAQKWTKLAQYSIPGAPTMNGGQATQFFFQGQAAMVINTATGVESFREAMGDTLAIHKLPNYSESVPASVQDTGVGGAGGGIIISNYSKHKQEAVKFAKFLLSQPEQIKQAEGGMDNFSTVADLDFGSLYKEPLRKVVQEWTNEPNAMFWPDNIYPPELTNELAAQAQLAWTAEISPQEFMKRLDAKRDALLKAP